MPVFKSPMEQGNLFLILDIVFPTSLDAAAVAKLRGALPPPLHAHDVADDSADHDVCEVEKMDPVASFKATAPDLSGDATQEEEREAGGPGGVQCAQQ
jgi:DnaJ family protein A protein 2